MLITCSFSWYQLYEEIKAVELTDARRYVNMCKSVCFYICLSRRIVHRNSMGGCRLQEVSYKDTSLFVCLSYKYTCTLTSVDPSRRRPDHASVDRTILPRTRHEHAYQK